MKKTSLPSESVVTGIVIANQWDKDGNIVGLSIYTDNEDVFWVTKNRLYWDLLHSVQKKIIAKGKISRLPENRNRLYVNSFIPVDTSTEPSFKIHRKKRD